MQELVQVGEFCPNPSCTDYGKRQNEEQQNLRKHGKSRASRQRFQCKTCGRTFTETVGTLFYDLRTPADEILQALTMIAEGSRMSSVSRITGHKEETISEWLRRAADQIELIETVLMAQYKVSRGQLDGLWAYVANKGEKRLTLRLSTAASSGARR